MSTLAGISKAIHFRFLLMVSRQILKPHHLRHRLQFTHDMRSGALGIIFLATVFVLGHENWFCVGNDSGCVWRCAGENVDEICRGTMKYPVGQISMMPTIRRERPSLL
jgi:hypothetical protein